MYGRSGAGLVAHRDSQDFFEGRLAAHGVQDADAPQGVEVRLDAVPPAKRKRIARETIDIYAPIANRLGLNSIYQELDDLSFRHLYPSRYNVLFKALKAARGNRREVVSKVLEAIKKKLAQEKIDAAVQGREKHLYSIFRKMREKHLTFANVLDVFGFRIIVKDVPSCYLVLGALHALRTRPRASAEITGREIFMPHQIPEIEIK